jgi:hypothetical protein
MGFGPNCLKGGPIGFSPFLAFDDSVAQVLSANFITLGGPVIGPAGTGQLIYTGSGTHTFLITVQFYEEASGTGPLQLTVNGAPVADAVATSPSGGGSASFQGTVTLSAGSSVAVESVDFFGLDCIDVNSQTDAVPSASLTAVQLD